MSKSDSSGRGRKASRKSKSKAAITRKRLSTGALGAAAAGAVVAAQQTPQPAAQRPEPQDARERIPQEALAQAATQPEPLAAAEDPSSEPLVEANASEEQEQAQAEAAEEETSAAGASREPGTESEPALAEEEPMQVAQASQAQGKPAEKGVEASGGKAGGTASGEAGGAAGGEAAGGAGLGSAGLVGIAGGVAIVASGGSAGGSAAGSAAGGFVSKGPLAGATVFADTNGNGVLDAGETSTTTNADGTYAFSTPVPSGVPLVVTGGTYKNAAGQDVAFTGTLKAPAGGTAITPFSTLAAAGIDSATLAELLGGRDYNSLSLSDFDSATDALETLAIALFDQLNAGASVDDLVDALEQANANGLDLSDPEAAIAASSSAVSGDPISAADVAKINAGLPFNAVAVFNSSTGAFDHYEIAESDLGLLGGVNQFGADPLWVQVEGTILGTQANPIEFSQLQALGVDKVLADDLAPYLRLIGSQVDNGDPGFTIAEGPNQGVVALDGTIGAIGGTELNTNAPLESNLGISMPDTTTPGDLAGFLGGADWNDPLNTLDDQD